MIIHFNKFIVLEPLRNHILQSIKRQMHSPLLPMRFPMNSLQGTHSTGSSPQAPLHGLLNCLLSQMSLKYKTESLPLILQPLLLEFLEFLSKHCSLLFVCLCSLSNLYTLMLENYLTGPHCMLCSNLFLLHQDDTYKAILKQLLWTEHNYKRQQSSPLCSLTVNGRFQHKKEFIEQIRVEQFCSESWLLQILHLVLQRHSKIHRLLGYKFESSQICMTNRQQSQIKLICSQRLILHSLEKAIKQGLSLYQIYLSKSLLIRLNLRNFITYFSVFLIHKFMFRSILFFFLFQRLKSLAGLAQPYSLYRVYQTPTSLEG